MNKLFWIGGLLALSVVGYLVASPFITVHQIRTGIVDQDAEILGRNIDFPTLRQNFKEQFNVQMVKKVTTSLKDNPFNALAIGLASTMTEGVIDALVTPAGLAQLMEGRKLTENPPISQEDRATRQAKILQNARYTYDAHDRFSVWAPNHRGEELRLILAREGLSWKLVNIIIPVER